MKPVPLVQLQQQQQPSLESLSCSSQEHPHHHQLPPHTHTHPHPHARAGRDCGAAAGGWAEVVPFTVVVSCPDSLLSGHFLISLGDLYDSVATLVILS